MLSMALAPCWSLRRVGPGGRSIATGLGRKPVRGCYSAEMRRPAIRSTAHDPILSMGAHDTGWIRVMGLIYGGGGGGGVVGHATRASSGRWDWFMGYVMGAHDWIGEMGLLWGGTPLGCDAGWDRPWGRDWIREMGLICGGTSWGRDTGWMWIMRLIYGGIPWGMQLDRGDGIDLWRRTMGAHDTG